MSNTGSPTKAGSGPSVVDGLPFAEDKKRYILEVLDPVLEEMVSEVLTDMPKSPLDFMIAYLQKKGQVAPSGKVSVLQRNDILKQELKRVSASIKEVGGTVSLAEGNEDDEDDDAESIPDDFQPTEGQKQKKRTSVSAEAYGEWNQKQAFTAPTYAKTDAQKERLKETLLRSFMFSALEEKDVETILMAMKEINFEAEQKVITEGEDGKTLFVIETGKLECVKKVDGEEKVVKTCEPGDVFGELALLYNAPRAASVIAKEACVCWELDRETFNHIVKDAATNRRSRYESFLKSVALLSSLEDYERSQISDALVSETFKKGEAVVKQDDPGDKFYIVEEGTLSATRGQDHSMDYKAGDYFGELALLKNQPRAATVAVSSETAKVLSMSRVAFTKLLGPLQELLTRQGQSYK